MADTHSPGSDDQFGIGRAEFPRPDFDDHDPVVMHDDLRECVAETLADARDARLHLGAMLDVLRACHPAYKIEAGLYVGNLLTIHVRLVRVVSGLELVDAQCGVMA